MATGSPEYDVIVIGSGFGGAMTAHSLLAAGRDVLLLERGDWVERGPDNWLPSGSMELTSHYSHVTPYHVPTGGHGKLMGGTYCVGGPSVFYGCVAFRFRERDFQYTRGIHGCTGAAWPIKYSDLEPYYTRAENILCVAGDDRDDPTRPYRSAAYPQAPAPLARISEDLAEAARALGCHPFRLPLAINYGRRDPDKVCVACRTCDTFACAVQAKNDLATVLVRPLLARGLELRPNTVVLRLCTENGRIDRVECYDKTRGEVVELRANTFVLSAGAIASPHILLASGLERRNPGGHTVGRYLIRHCNIMVFGVFPRRPDPDRTFHKQLAIHDFYFGGPRYGLAKLGGIQQVATPPAELVKHYLPRGLRTLLAPAVEHLTGLLVIAEDQPQYHNGMAIDHHRRDAVGLPSITVRHRYSERDWRACAALTREAGRILRKAGAMYAHHHKIKTFSHALGTVRMGPDPQTSALDEFCRYRGVSNLYVVDGSSLPTSGGVNPSLTIAANALRVGEFLAREARP